MGFAGTDRPGVLNHLPAWLTMGWGVLFGGLNIYWAGGGTWLLNRLALAIQQAADDGSGLLLVMTALGGIGKILIGIIALATIKTWGRAVSPGVLISLLTIVGVGMLVYGLANWVQVVLAASGLIGVPASIGRDALVWYIMLWEPAWMLGGVLSLASANVFHHRRSS